MPHEEVSSFELIECLGGIHLDFPEHALIAVSYKIDSQFESSH